MSNTYRDRLRQVALQNDGYVTVADSVGIGVPAVELRKLCSRGAFLRIERSVYRNLFFPPNDLDQLHEAVLDTGPSVYLFGPTVLDVVNIGNSNPTKIHIHSPRRHSRTFADLLQVEAASEADSLAVYQGFPWQHVFRHCGKFTLALLHSGGLRW